MRVGKGGITLPQRDTEKTKRAVHAPLVLHTLAVYPAASLHLQMLSNFVRRA